MIGVRVCRLLKVRPHPNADRLDILTLFDGEEWKELVSGKHYVEGQLGIHIPEGALLPGPVAVEMWLWGAKPDRPWIVTAKNMRGIVSAGLFSGREYRVDPNDSRSQEKYDQHSAAGDELLSDGSFKWSRWNDAWQLGDEVSEELGVIVLEEPGWKT